MSEMIERVARAIVTADERNGGPPWDYIVGLGKHAISARMDQARAAIEEMGKPTEAMLEAGAVAEGDGNLEAQALSLWAAMIDAALK